MSLITDYIISLCRLYGIVPKEKIAEIYNMQNEEEITLTQIEHIMENEQVMLEKYFVYVDEKHFIHETIILFDEFNSYMSQKEGKPYYIPNKNELLKYRNQFYFEKPKEYMVLVDYVAKELMEGDSKSANTVVEDIQGLCQVEASPTEIFKSISREIDFKSKKKISETMDLVVNLGNNTRLWSNNGYTPNELFETHEKQNHRPLPDDHMTMLSQRGTYHKAKKIGRNDPCPCGSGKKYKKCCL